jgi:GNAT superfamily N-acetyltransferase
MVLRLTELVMTSDHKSDRKPDSCSESRSNSNEQSATIRPATPADYNSIVACAEAAYSIYIDRIGKPPAPMVADFAAQIAAKQVAVLVSDSQLHGFFVSFPQPADDTGRAWFLENIAVHPSSQRSGFGRQLINAVIEQAKIHNCNRIELYTNERMVENIAWYTRLGFTETRRVTEAGFKRVYFVLELSE